MTTQLSVRTALSTYPLVIGSKILENFGEYLQNLGVSAGTDLFLITDETVHDLLYSERIMTACEQRGFHICESVIVPRDESKSLVVAESLYEQMLNFGLRRSGVVLALGGGVVGDLAGFVAATYLRGVRFIQIPTTLLAHDSSIGGKVGINLKRGKNLVGAFHQPIAVLYDMGILRSLPIREWQNGMAEVIKHAIIGDADLFVELEQNPVAEFPGEDAAEVLIARAAKVKIDIVEEDVFEQERRMWLNLGHTVGHAVEQVSHYQLGHGEAIAIGLAVEAQIATNRGWLKPEDLQRIKKLLTIHGLPVRAPDYHFEEILDTLQVDKKHTSERWTFVLPRVIGEVAIIRDVTQDELQTAWYEAKEERLR